MEFEEHIQTRATSRRTADASPVVLGPGDRTRLVFKPMLVDNPNNPDAGLSGIFVYQRKVAADRWEDVESIDLTTLKAGEGVRLDLHSGEVLALFQGLSRLYSLAATEGVPMGSRHWLTVPKSQVFEDVQRMLAGGDGPGLLKVFLEWMKSRRTETLAADLRTAGSDALINFDAAVGAARLAGFLAVSERNKENGSEAFWQDLLESNSWVLSQVYAQPLVIIRGQAYVGGKGIDNRDGNVVDYLYKNALTGNALLIEIKTPLTRLLAPSAYRNRIFGCSSEMSGATQQLLSARASLIQEYDSLSRRDPDRFNVFSPRALLVAGWLPPISQPDERRSFELFRNGLRDVDIVTFDELIAKARALYSLLCRA
ncbi:MAG TPA: Shedu immune nuclease family protein [Acidimicrobiales bacterium]|nr:Shedu immune nuclease family protein [Acidimicrobiales bacterium]